MPVGAPDPPIQTGVRFSAGNVRFWCWCRSCTHFATVLRRHWLFLVLSPLVVACAPGAGSEDDEGEPAEGEDAVVALTEPDETAPASAIAAAPLDTAATDFIDVRGMGDSG